MIGEGGTGLTTNFFEKDRIVDNVSEHPEPHFRNIGVYAEQSLALDHDESILMYLQKKNATKVANS